MCVDSSGKAGDRAGLPHARVDRCTVPTYGGEFFSAFVLADIMLVRCPMSRLTPF